MSGDIVLVVAQAQDATADLVVDALLARGADVARIDTTDFPGSREFAAEVSEGLVYKSLSPGVVT